MNMSKLQRKIIFQANFKRQLEKHNRKRLSEHGRTEFTEEFEKILIYLEGGTRFESKKP